MHRWDPDRYLTYADERGRPFVDLLQRVPVAGQRSIVDLGCGPGNLTDLLADIWTDAHVVGVDSSPEMVAAAQARGSRVDYRVGDLRAWAAGDETVDLLVSNATLQWLPDHLELLPSLVGRVAPGGHLAFQVPGNFAEPSHTIRDELAADPRFAAHTAGVAVPDSHDAATYLDVLARLGCRVEAWETTYLHVLSGPDPVFAWVSGTGARPTLQALPDGVREEFEAEFKERLRAAYPERPHGVVLPFRRIFVVARVPGDDVAGAAD